MEVTTLSLQNQETTDALKAEVEQMLESERQRVVALALAVFEQQWIGEKNPISGSQDAVNYFRLKLAESQQELFAVLYLNVRHQVIAYETLFRGSINNASVPPRVVAQRCLEINAASILVAHNHPSGVAEPSQADIALTGRLKEALSVFEVKLLDHIVVTLDDSVSLAERGLL